jgi:sec-independent protein translocase protein TatA
MFGIGTTEILIIGALILLMFGGKKLPELGRSMALGVSNFKKGLNDDSDKQV